jgi:4-hydroxybenzoate polyprenyltransferase
MPPWLSPPFPTQFSFSTPSFSYPQAIAAQLIQPAALLVVGSFFLSNAIHGWNDLIDAPYDALIARTRERPVVRGAVSKTGALLFTISQGVASTALLAILLPNPKDSLRVAWPSIVANLYYPWAKRHTHFAQYVLGICLAWGVVVGTAGVLEAADPGKGADVWAGTTRTSTACLTAAAVLWTVIYDTIYAFQDMDDDVKVGLKSTAVLFDEWTKEFLAVNLGGLAGLLAYLGKLLELGGLYHGFAVGGCLLSLGIMIIKVDLRDPASCWWWFRYGFWLAGGSIALGLILECLS